MTLTPYFQFGNIQAVESANFPLSRGVSPSVCTISILPRNDLDRVPKTMTFGDGIRSVSFGQCLIVDTSPQISGDGFQSLTVSIHDRRWKWKYGQVSGVYNVRRSSQLDEATTRTPRQLAELCFRAMGETKYDISRMPNDTNPYVSWDMERPDAALDRLCQAVNAHVVLRSDDVAAIYPDGFGADLPNIPSSSSSEAFEFGVVPGQVGIATAPFAWEFDFALEPVGLDVDGSIRPLQELSFTPKTEFGWYDSLPPDFVEVDQFYRKLAQVSVFKWFRIIPPKRVRLPSGGDQEVVSIKQFLPLLDNQLTYAKLTIEQFAKNKKQRILDSGWPRLPSQVYGVFYDEEGKGEDNMPKVERNTFKFPKAIYGKSFTIDNEKGILKCSDPVYRINPDSIRRREPGERAVPLIFNPDIYLRTGTNFRDAETGAPYRLEKKLAIKGGLDKSIVSWETREDITPEQRLDHKTQKYVDNLGKVSEQLSYYLSYAAARYKPKTPASGSYPWLVPFSPDGRIAQVIYEIDGVGFIGTAIHRDIEGLLNIATYTERRQEVARLATQQMLARELTKQDESKDKK